MPEVSIEFPDVSTLRSHSVDELKEMLKEARRSLANIRFQHKVSNLQNVRTLRNARRHIARILTLINEKEQEF